MNEELTANADVTIDASLAEVWDALVNPEVIKRYMMGATVVSDWREGSPIAWRGEWKGKPFEDHGRIVELRAPRHLKYTHFSPLTGLLDVPENYHNVTVDVTGQDGAVHVTLSQDNNKTRAARDDSQKNWEMMLKGLKNAVERPS